MKGGQVVQQMSPLISESTEVPAYDETSLIATIRADQAGETTFPEFLQGAWQAGVISYMVDFEKRAVTYNGSNRETYTESYPSVIIS